MSGIRSGSGMISSSSNFYGTPGIGTRQDKNGTSRFLTSLAMISGREPRTQNMSASTVDDESTPAMLNEDLI
jgi:hypothetical protein